MADAEIEESDQEWERSNSESGTGSESEARVTDSACSDDEGSDDDWDGDERSGELLDEDAFDAAARSLDGPNSASDDEEDGLSTPKSGELGEDSNNGAGQGGDIASVKHGEDSADDEEEGSDNEPFVWESLTDGSTGTTVPTATPPPYEVDASKAHAHPIAPNAGGMKLYDRQLVSILQRARKPMRLNLVLGELYKLVDKLEFKAALEQFCDQKNMKSPLSAVAFWVKLQPSILVKPNGDQSNPILALKAGPTAKPLGTAGPGGKPLGKAGPGARIKMGRPASSGAAEAGPSASTTKDLVYYLVQTQVANAIRTKLSRSHLDECCDTIIVPELSPTPAPMRRLKFPSTSGELSPIWREVATTLSMDELALMRRMQALTVADHRILHAAAVQDSAAAMAPAALATGANGTPDPRDSVYFDVQERVALAIRSKLSDFHLQRCAEKVTVEGAQHPCVMWRLKLPPPGVAVPPANWELWREVARALSPEEFSLLQHMQTLAAAEPRVAGARVAAIPLPAAVAPGSMIPLPPQKAAAAAPDNYQKSVPSTQPFESDLSPPTESPPDFDTASTLGDESMDILTAAGWTLAGSRYQDCLECSSLLDHLSGCEDTGEFLLTRAIAAATLRSKESSDDPIDELSPSEKEEGLVDPDEPADEIEEGGGGGALAAAALAPAAKKPSLSGAISAEDMPSSACFVKNLESTITDDELKDIFVAFVVDQDKDKILIAAHYNKSYAFVDLGSQEAVARAVSASRGGGIEYGDKKLTVEPSKKPVRLSGIKAMTDHCRGRSEVWAAPGRGEAGLQQATESDTEGADEVEE